MKIWKVLSGISDVKCYVKCNETDTRDTSYIALQIARKEIDKNLCTTQILDTKRNEQMIDGMPVFEIQ